MVTLKTYGRNGFEGLWLWMPVGGMALKPYGFEALWIWMPMWEWWWPWTPMTKNGGSERLSWRIDGGFESLKCRERVALNAWVGEVALKAYGFECLWKKIELSKVALNAYKRKWWLWKPMGEMALKPYGFECQCESGGGFEHLWRKMVALNA